MGEVIIIPAMGDNFIYLYKYADDKCLVIDPGTAEPVLMALEANDLEPTDILITHHHGDHTGGVSAISRKYRCRTIEPTGKGQDQTMAIEGMQVKIISTPGHTADSVCYCITQEGQKPRLFTGDTMFIAGCGRVFETDMQTMYNSLQKLADLPDETLVYPGHDYTQENYEFALTIEPDNETVKKALDNFGQTCAVFSDVPSTIGREKETNVFIRSKDAKQFADRRTKKDRF